MSCVWGVTLQWDSFMEWTISHPCIHLSEIAKPCWKRSKTRYTNSLVPYIRGITGIHTHISYLPTLIPWINCLYRCVGGFRELVWIWWVGWIHLHPFVAGKYLSFVMFCIQLPLPCLIMLYMAPNFPRHHPTTLNPMTISCTRPDMVHLLSVHFYLTIQNALISSYSTMYRIVGTR